MQIAIIENNTVTSIGDYRQLFPQTSFHAGGPTDEWLAEHNCKKVNLFLTHDRDTEKLVSCAPYIDGEWVYTVEVQPLSEEELAQKQAETLDRTKKSLTDAVQGHLDAEAQAKGYDNIVSACSYAAAPNPFQAESQSFITWRGNVWATCYAIMAEVEAGTRPIPTTEELIAELPEFV